MSVNPNIEDPELTEDEQSVEHEAEEWVGLFRIHDHNQPILSFMFNWLLILGQFRIFNIRVNTHGNKL